MKSPIKIEVKRELGAQPATRFLYFEMCTPIAMTFHFRLPFYGCNV